MWEGVVQRHHPRKTTVKSNYRKLEMMSKERNDTEGTRERCTAVVLAGGSGSRMKSNVAKQFMQLGGKPLLWYSLQVVQQSEIIDDCILVVGGVSGQGNLEAMEYARREILERYGFTKVTAVVEGGTERCWSVENAMALLRSRSLDEEERHGYVFIHDSARPFITEEIIRRTYDAVQQYHACVAAMPSKDTVKLATLEGFADSTPDRNLVWNIQTPQVFDRTLITDVYRRLWETYYGKSDAVPVTDDASVVEQFSTVKVKLVEGSYKNIKITTPEDIKVAEVFLKEY